MEIKDVEKFEHKDAINENKKMGDKEEVGFKVVKELERKEEGNEDDKKIERIELSHIMEKTMGSYPRFSKPMQRWMMISIK